MKIPLVWNAPTCDPCGHPEVDIFLAEGRVLLLVLVVGELYVRLGRNHDMCRVGDLLER